MSIDPLGIIGLRAFRTSLFVFMIYWLLGFADRVAYSRKVPKLYRHVMVPGAMRWFFGCKPVAGPIPIFAFVLQISALLEFVVSLALILIWPLARQNYDVVIIVTMSISMLLALQIAKRIERKQQKNS